MASLAGDGPRFLPFQRPGRLAGGWLRERVLAFRRSRAPLLARKRPALSDQRRESEPWAGPGREREELVIVCSGTMPTFEPLTTKQTTLALSLHCPNRVY